MYDRTRLLKIQEEEEKAFHALPKEQIKMATMKTFELEALRDELGNLPIIELPPLLSEEKQVEKKQLLSEGFADWG